MGQAECRKPHVDPNWFYPGRGKSNDQWQAKFTCFVCPVRQQCKAYADEVGDEWGVWAGENRQTVETEEI